MRCKKSAFATWEEAERWGRQQWLQVPYLCPHCGAFHVTKSPQADNDYDRAQAARELADRQDRLAAAARDFHQARRRGWTQRKKKRK